MNEKEKEKLQRLEARTKRQNEAIKEKYDRLSCIVPKGTKERIKKAGLSANGLIAELLIEYLDKNGF